MPSLVAIRTQLWHWKQALMGPLVTICLLFYQQVAGKSPTWGWFAALICGGLAWQFYTELKKAQETKRHDYPKLFLRHTDLERQGKGYKDLKAMSGFFLQVDGDKKAYNVKITTPDVLGREHTRLEMLWGSPNLPIGNDPVPVSALCSQRKGNAGSSIVGPQVRAYMDMKASPPRELIAVVNFKDVDGNDCLVRKFKIHIKREITGELVTHCDLFN